MRLTVPLAAMRIHAFALLVTSVGCQPAWAWATHKDDGIASGGVGLVYAMGCMYLIVILIFNIARPPK